MGEIKSDTVFSFLEESEVYSAFYEHFLSSHPDALI